MQQRYLELNDKDATGKGRWEFDFVEGSLLSFVFSLMLTRGLDRLT